MSVDWEMHGVYLCSSGNECGGVGVSAWRCKFARVFGPRPKNHSDTVMGALRSCGSATAFVPPQFLQSWPQSLRTHFSGPALASPAHSANTQTLYAISVWVKTNTTVSTKGFQITGSDPNAENGVSRQDEWFNPNSIQIRIKGSVPKKHHHPKFQENAHSKLRFNLLASCNTLIKRTCIYHVLIVRLHAPIEKKWKGGSCENWQLVLVCKLLIESMIIFANLIPQDTDL